MTRMSPADLSGLGRQALDRACDEIDEELTPLFRRWPNLSRREMKDLRRLYDHRLRLAKRIGALRTSKVGQSVKRSRHNATVLQ